MAVTRTWPSSRRCYRLLLPRPRSRGSIPPASTLSSPEDVSPHRAAEPSGRAVLIRDRLRPPDPCADPQHVPREPFVADSRAPVERGRIDRHLLRPGSAGGQGEQLGADRPDSRVRADVPRLRGRPRPCRQDLGACGRRKGHDAVSMIKPVASLTARDDHRRLRPRHSAPSRQR
jgi:hypothetical protein